MLCGKQRPCVRSGEPTARRESAWESRGDDPPEVGVGAGRLYSDPVAFVGGGVVRFRTVRYDDHSVFETFSEGADAGLADVVAHISTVVINLVRLI